MTIIRQSAQVRAAASSVTQTPGAPASVTATLVGDSGITLTWQDPADWTALAGYRVYRATDGSYTLQGTVDPVAYPATATYSQGGLAPATYTYQVACYSVAGVESARTASNAVTVSEVDVIEWLATTPVTLGPYNEGVTNYANLANYANIPAGTTPVFSIVSASHPDINTINAITGQLTIPGSLPASADSYSAVIGLSDGIAAPVNRTFGFAVQAVETSAWPYPPQDDVAYTPIVRNGRGPGMDTKAGTPRSGIGSFRLYAVNTLADNSTTPVQGADGVWRGSLRGCIVNHNTRSPAGASSVVFEVAGMIELASEFSITRGNLSIYGQTAPSPGIIVRNRKFRVGGSNVLIQHMDFRHGDTYVSYQDDSFGIANDNSTVPSDNIVIDHCNFIWGNDENFEGYSYPQRVTLSHCLFAECIGVGKAGDNGYHQDNILFYDGAGRAGIDLLIFGCLLSTSFERNPLARECNKLTIANTCVYNAANRGLDIQGGESAPRSVTQTQVIGSIYRRGPNTPTNFTAILGQYLQTGSKVYLSGNAGFNNGTTVLNTGNQWALTTLSSTWQSTSPLYTIDGLVPKSDTITDNSAILNAICGFVGSRPGDRDVTSAALINEVLTGTGNMTNNVTNHSVASYSTGTRATAYGGWPYATGTRAARTFTPVANYATIGASGRTLLEEQIDSLENEIL